MSVISENDAVVDYVQTASVREIAAPQLAEVINDLVYDLTETVNAGSPLGFMPPITLETARAYWVSLLPELRSGRRILLVADYENSVVGSAQIAMSRRGNSPHRAEVEKVFVSRVARGRGVGTTLMNAVHEAALRRGRTLLTLNTRYDQPAHHWYKALGYN